MAGMFDDPEAGLLLGSRGDTAVSDPEAEAYLKMVSDFMPGFGDVMSAKDAYEAIKAGNYSEAALASLGILPFVPNMTRIIKPSELGFDIRYDPRKKEIDRLNALTTTVESRKGGKVPEIALEELEGRPFITSMSDRTAAGGLLTRINDVDLAMPVNLQGGQGFMFENPGMVWASDKNPVKQLSKAAEKLKKVYGVDPVYLPWRMAPTGGDFATMTGEAMLGYAQASMPRNVKASLNKEIKNIIPDWKGVDNPQSIAQFRSVTGDTRKAVQNMMDKKFRDKGGLSIGEARLAVADAAQLSAMEGGLMNVGEVFAGAPIIDKSGHATYAAGLPGQGLGVLKDAPAVYELLPSSVKQRGIVDPRQPSAYDIRALQMKPYAGVITEDILRNIENLRNTGLQNPLLKD
jgi:hypothetical protein